ncbi:hypothetical protein F6R98_10365 [Candidatus Methylospira mobilis]|uniref:Uncharacterized protein n=1 Tax=Candidatus Methylospira mobilis TaxID=1808979 RepID=A0A5Q0BLJ4_9GAMM|nr:phage regulatory CII family protein [Candidatus Methylospira mobilis]QFY42967.1 hypothetical protein F6R98_10365 [Candidatus Methylospira mobilis]
MRRIAKQTHRALFLALQADAKEFPGGIRSIAESMGMNGTNLANGLNPDHDALPPSFGVVLEVIMLAQAKRAVFYLTQMVGQVPMDFEVLEPRSPAEAIALFLSLVEKVSAVLGHGSHAAKDGHFDAEERKALEPMLFALMQACGILLQAIKR